MNATAFSLDPNRCRGLAMVLLISLSACQMEKISKPRGELKHFITVSGGRLMNGGKEFRFLSYNIPNLHCIEDNMVFNQTNAWRLPDSYEMEDAFKSIWQMGGQVVRTYTITVRRQDDTENIPRYVLGPGEFNEQAFRTLDTLLALANDYHVRVIIPFVDNWIWMGGRAEYAAFRGLGKDDFWTNRQLIDDFKSTINYIINRKNTVTGSLYRDDKAILAWETGNELQCPHSWTSEIAAYIKSLDPNHLVIDGFHAPVLRQESIDDPNIDLVTTHHYDSDPVKVIGQITNNRNRSRGKKPYFVGEFGFMGTTAIEAILDEVIRQGTSGALIWSLRFHNRDGGFYWHSEPSGGGLFKAYHWPGFVSGEAYDEAQLVHLMRRKAYMIQSRDIPDLPPPEPPVLIPFHKVYVISWQGSAGAASYDVLRSQSRDGPWITVGKDISDADVQYRPLFNDTRAEFGASYYYCVVAKNRTGSSDPSNVIGPVDVLEIALIDEFQNFGRIFQRSGEMELVTANSRQAKEDCHRLKADRGARIDYFVPGTISDWRVFCFYPDKMNIPRFSISRNGTRFEEISYDEHSYFSDGDDYGYWKPVLFSGQTAGKNARYMRIEFTGPIQLSRVEVIYGEFTRSESE